MWCLDFCDNLITIQDKMTKDCKNLNRNFNTARFCACGFYYAY